MTAATPGAPHSLTAHDLQRLAGAIEFVGYPTIAAHLRNVAVRLVDYDNPELVIVRFQSPVNRPRGGRSVAEFVVADAHLSQFKPGDRFALVRLPEAGF